MKMDKLVTRYAQIKKNILNNSNTIHSKIYNMNIATHKAYYLVLLLLDWVQGVVAFICPW
jgi:hypothetical protein